MRRHMEAQQILERDKHHTYWRLHLPMLLNTKKRFTQKSINTNNTYVVGQIAKITYGRVAHVAWERGCAKNITLCMFWRILQAIM